MDRVDDIESMLADIATEFRLTRRVTGREQAAPRVVQAMRNVPRDAFVPAELRAAAYANRPLPIGRSQTISQPFIVALMTDLLDLEPGWRVLEIGTGSAYQAAVLSCLCAEVFSVERLPDLAATARARLAGMGIDNVHVRCGDGNAGWPEHAPYDAILVTAAAPRIPDVYATQLRPGGRMVIPVGPRYGPQRLILATRDVHGGLDTRAVLDVAFVPLVAPR